MDVRARREVHDRVRAPARGPDEFLDFFRYGGRHRRVAHIGVNLDEEVASDDHRLALGVVDIGRDDGPPPSDFLPDELGRDDARNLRAARIAGMLFQEAGVFQRLHPLVLADRDKLHLGRNDAPFRVMHLRHPPLALGTARRGKMVEAEVCCPFVGQALLSKGRRPPLQSLGIAALLDPVVSQPWQPAADIHVDVWIGKGAGGVVEVDVRVGFGAEAARRVGLADAAHRHADVRAAAFDVGFLRTGQGPRHLSGEAVGGVVDRRGSAIAGGRAGGGREHGFVGWQVNALRGEARRRRRAVSAWGVYPGARRHAKASLRWS